MATFLTKKIRAILFFTLIVLFLNLWLSEPFIKFITDFLSKTERVDANVLLVEQWLPRYALEFAYNEFKKTDYEHIIITGLNNIDEFFVFAMNGYLIFYTEKTMWPVDDSDNHIIEVEAFSEIEGEQCAHFNLYVNDSLIAEFNADKRKRRYMAPWYGPLETIDSIMVQFVNDGVSDWGDRNLYVKEIIIDNNITIPYQNNSVYKISAIYGIPRIKNNISSYAEVARNYLLSMGIDSSKIIVVFGKRAPVNRTLHMALAFRDWLKISDIEVNGINIVSIGSHSRRTWMTYKKVLDKSYNIGIISLPDYTRHSRTSKVLNILRETLALFYYWVILIPY